MDELWLSDLLISASEKDIFKATPNEEISTQICIENSLDKTFITSIVRSNKVTTSSENNEVISTSM